MTVELSKSRENLNDLAKELDIRVELIYRWRREFLEKREGHRGAAVFQVMENSGKLLKKRKLPA